MASRTIISLSRSELASLAAPDSKITGVQHLASYNWLDRPVATISVPGKSSLSNVIVREALV
jgi:hypothetical protein